jgi:glutamine synthetase
LHKRIDELKSNYAFLDIQLCDFFGKLKTISLPTSYITEEVLAQGIGFDASNLHYAEVTKSDLVLVPDLDTLQENNFNELPSCTCLGHVGCFPAGSLKPQRFPFDPRTTIQNALEYLRSKKLAHQLMVLPELEFYIFNHTEFSTSPMDNYIQIDSEEPIINKSKGYHASAPFDSYASIRMHMVQELQAWNIPVKYHHHEVGLPGQCEIELDFLPLDKAADAILQSKHIVRNVAQQFQLQANFMPKPMYGLPGSGMHLHMYLTNDQGKSIFFDQNAPYHLSTLGMHFMGGILLHLGAIMAFSNPSTNSYKRLVSGYEAPQDKSFAKSSRNAAIRIPAYTSLEETRFEFRTGDATANPYYTLTALLMAGIDGVEKQIDPENPQMIKNKELIPRNLYEAMEALKSDQDFLKPVISQELIEEWISKKVKEADFPNNYPNVAEFDQYINY